MGGYRTIVVGTDGSETAAAAQHRAALLARKVGGRLILVCASDPDRITDDVAKEVLAFARDAARREGVDAETEVRQGPPADVIAAVATERDADLAVVGNVGMDEAHRFRITAVAEKVAGEAPCDLLIVYTRDGRPPEPATDPEASEGVYHRIVVGTDGSPTASEAARKAFDLGMMLGIGVTVVYAAGDPDLGAIHLERAVKAKPRALGVESRLVEGEPAGVLVRTAEEAGADLIVVGNKGTSGARRVILGSVPNRVAHEATTDVLVAKTTERTADHLAPGTGGVVDLAGRQLAVYRDEAGELHAYSPRCTHMGCTVDWNDADKTWDCPCHGSRYAKDGKVISGPAEEDLAPLRAD